MQHVLRISRKIDYGLRAMIYLASIPQESVVPFREIARQMDVPEDFLAKILKTLVDQGLVRSTRGPARRLRAGADARRHQLPRRDRGRRGARSRSTSASTARTPAATPPSAPWSSVWRQGQERMLDVFRQAQLSELAFKPADDGQIGLVQLHGAALRSSSAV